MEGVILGILGFIVLFFLIFFIQMPIGFAMALIGWVGVMVLAGPRAGFGTLGVMPYTHAASYTMCVLPLFILMGHLANYSGTMRGLFNLTNKWFGHFRGGLTISVVTGSAILGACTGSSTACSTVMVPTAWPEMKKLGYNPAIALGSIAAGGTLAFMIPPSMSFIVYGMLAEQSVGKLFIAGILPGLLLTSMFIMAILILVRLNPDLAPPFKKSSWNERISSLKEVLPMLILVIAILGSIWLGVCTPEEAGAIGVGVTFFLGLINRELSKGAFFRALFLTCRNTAMVLIIMIGAMIFNQFMALTNLPFLLAEFIANSALSPAMILVFIMILFIILGMIMDPLGFIVLTVPILLPTLAQLGVNLIWFGVFQCALTELALITPPIGVNVFVVSGMAKDVPMQIVFKGILPFTIVMCLFIILLMAFPQIALFLPGTMKF